MNKYFVYHFFVIAEMTAITSTVAPTILSSLGVAFGAKGSMIQFKLYINERILLANICNNPKANGIVIIRKFPRTFLPAGNFIAKKAIMIAGK